ncbi:probable mediator of RNA polymerase II transcription subunit 26b [Gastrolobium bilobum]|uniref:probable mediator of RNA polymerase II transcription subunit 26b n=1 Tax=Gastrolobium bilobum TaxID=150636 RepID=UPI002AAF6323|nr:probable mediator of RNA polymerase II transcription subunit 26b [Gastrolobium bilobum]
MTMKSESLDHWRNYFSTAKSYDIFDIIHHSIMVAASDFPKEFKLRRDGIAERLFSCMLTTKCLGCERVDHEDVDDGLALEAGSSEDVREEVLRIGNLLLNFKEESDSVLFESLRRLQLMELKVDLLEKTKIGKAVNPLRKHGSKDIRQLASTLIDCWKEMVDEWCKASTTTAIAASEGTPDSVNPSVPMDEGALFLAQIGSIELSQDDVQFFDGMDDYENPQQSGQFKSEASIKPSITAKDSKSQQPRKNEVAVRLNKPETVDNFPVRPPKSTMQRKSNMEPKMQPKIENNTIPKKPPMIQKDKSKFSDEEAAVQVKLEATKRKIQERYQRVENAKRQRTIQVLEINDLPKQGGGQRNSHFKPGNHNRQWANARR